MHTLTLYKEICAADQDTPAKKITEIVTAIKKLSPEAALDILMFSPPIIALDSSPTDCTYVLNLLEIAKNYTLNVEVMKALLLRTDPEVLIRSMNEIKYYNDDNGALASSAWLFADPDVASHLYRNALITTRINAVNSRDDSGNVYIDRAEDGFIAILMTGIAADEFAAAFQPSDDAALTMKRMFGLDDLFIPISAGRTNASVRYEPNVAFKPQNLEYFVQQFLHSNHVPELAALLSQPIEFYWRSHESGPEVKAAQEATTIWYVLTEFAVASEPNTMALLREELREHAAALDEQKPHIRGLWDKAVASKTRKPNPNSKSMITPQTRPDWEPAGL